METNHQSQWRYIGMLAALLLLSGSANAITKTNVSSQFSIGYGAHAAGAVTWDTVETSSANSPTTQGDFTFSPTLSGTAFTGQGPAVQVIAGVRTLIDGGGSGTPYSGNSSVFAVTINASCAPPDAAPTPDYQITLVIDSIRIRGLNYSQASFPGYDLAFSETTAGHTTNSPSVTLNDAAGILSNFNSAALYTQLAWNPDDYVSAGTNTSRSFALVAAHPRMVDDFEVFGHVELRYNAYSTSDITSLPFSIGYGANVINTTSTWDTVETSSANSPTNQGDFTFSSAITGSYFSGAGPAIQVIGGTRTLADGSGYTKMSGNSSEFAVTINASWAGSAPGHAAPTPGYQISLVIDSIRIYGLNYNQASFPGYDLAFSETTTGYTTNSPSITLNDAGGVLANFDSAAFYTQLAWDPGDYFSTGTNTSRSFALVAAHPRMVDDFEVFGHVVLRYNSVVRGTVVKIR